MYHI
jgi:pyruvate dehydrogenase phosphatase regulatory subunit